MNNKVKNSVEAIIQGFILFLIFLPGFYVYEKDSYSSGITKRSINLFKSTDYISGWDYGNLDIPEETFYDLRRKLCIVVISIVVISTILFLIQLKANKNWGLLVCFPVFELVSLCIFSYYTADAYGFSGSAGYWTSEYLRLGVWFYIEIVLLISLSIYSFICYRKVDEYGDIIKSKLSKVDSITDEIKKFKELLDNGVITEEEFQVKKDRLLNQ